MNSTGARRFNHRSILACDSDTYNLSKAWLPSRYRLFSTVRLFQIYWRNCELLESPVSTLVGSLELTDISGSSQAQSTVSSRNASP